MGFTGGSLQAGVQYRVDNWVTVEQIDARTFVISAYGHWENTHSYLLPGEESAVLIDTGTGIGDIKGVAGTITGFPVSLVTTLTCWDHIGGHAEFSDICMSMKRGG